MMVGNALARGDLRVHIGNNSAVHGGNPANIDRVTRRERQVVAEYGCEAPLKSRVVIKVNMEVIGFQSDVLIPQPPPSGPEGGLAALLTEVQVAGALAPGTDGLIFRTLESVGSFDLASGWLPPGVAVGQLPATRLQFLKVKQLCDQYNVSRSWVYKRTRKGALDPLPVIRIGGLKFDAELVRQYIAARQRPATGGTLSSSDGNARVNGKGYRSLTRRRFQTGSVRLREDRGSKWWEGFYREDVVDESGKIVRKRKSVNLGLLSDIPTKRSAQRQLGEILADINDAN
jgi:hypothetical protein